MIYPIYAIVFWVKGGQTPGKMVMRIKVIGVDGKPLSWEKATIGYFARVVSTYLLGLGLIWVALDSKRQGWHDKLAKTYVVPKDTRFSLTEIETIATADAKRPGRNILFTLLSYISILVLVSIIVIAILLLLGPIIGNTFSTIVEVLEGTPTPAP